MKIIESTKVYIAGCGGMLGRAVYEVLFNPLDWIVVFEKRKLFVFKCKK